MLFIDVSIMVKGFELFQDLSTLELVGVLPAQWIIFFVVVLLVFAENFHQNQMVDGLILHFDLAEGEGMFFLDLMFDFGLDLD